MCVQMWGVKVESCWKTKYIPPNKHHLCRCDAFMFQSYWDSVSCECLFFQPFLPLGNPMCQESCVLHRMS